MRAADWEIKRDDAIRILKAIEPPEGYYLAFSGGKDSCVIKALADMAKVKYDAHYAVSGIDPPELVRFIRDKHPDVKRIQNAPSMLKLIATRGYPLRHRRWCCEIYKHPAKTEGITILGVRREESHNRADYEMLGVHPRNKSIVMTPIVNWNEGDVWEFINHHNIPYCSLYDEGWTRLGCIGCPMQSAHVRRKELERWPGFEKAYRIAFRKLHANRLETNPKAVEPWTDGDAMFDWWISNKPISDAYQGRLL